MVGTGTMANPSRTDIAYRYNPAFHMECGRSTGRTPPRGDARSPSCFLSHSLPGRTLGVRVQHCDIPTFALKLRSGLSGEGAPAGVGLGDVSVGSGAGRARSSRRADVAARRRRRLATRRSPGGPQDPR
ncbi:unnamed protein product, partial [Iphiclides podalirius]